MSTNPVNENEILREGNYFQWEFNARMALARKDLLDHIEYKEEAGGEVVDTTSTSWKSADRKALAVLARMLSPQYQTMIRTAKTAKEAWTTLESFFVKRTMHNRIQLRKRVHEFKMTKGDEILEHLLKFDNLIMGMSAVGETMSEDEQLVILLGSLTDDFDAIIKIIENKEGVTMMEVKEMLLRESQKMKEREVSETALRASGQDENRQYRRQQRGGHRGGRGARGRQRRTDGGSFRGQCFNCNSVGHKQVDCPSNSKSEHVFFATTQKITDWLVDSGATSHMTFSRDDFVTYEQLDSNVTISSADGGAMYAVGVGAVAFQALNGTKVTLTGILHVPNLARRLISVPALTLKDVTVVFHRNSCVITYRGENADGGC